MQGAVRDTGGWLADDRGVSLPVGARRLESVLDLPVGTALEAPVPKQVLLRVHGRKMDGVHVQRASPPQAQSDADLLMPIAAAKLPAGIEPLAAHIEHEAEQFLPRASGAASLNVGLGLPIGEDSATGLQAELVGSPGLEPSREHLNRLDSACRGRVVVHQRDGAVSLDR